MADERQASTVAKVSMHLSIGTLVAAAIVVGSYMSKVSAHDEALTRDELRIEKLQADNQSILIRIERMDQNLQYLVDKEKRGK